MVKFLTDFAAKKYKGKTALLRIDLNIVDGDADKSLRIKGIIPTVKLLLKNKIRVVILSHRGRPTLVKGEKLNVKNKKLSLKPLAMIFEKKLKVRVNFIGDLEGAERKIEKSKNRIFLLENLRFWRGEEKNNISFAKQLSRLGDFYVNDAFAVSHRKNASVCAITKSLPAYGGLLMEKEIKNLTAVKCTKPLVIILGGAKFEDKLGVVKNLYRRADYFLPGSAIANNHGVARRWASKMVFPVDLWFDRPGRAMDVGRETLKKYGEIIKKARTIIWNGPLGDIDKKKFQFGTRTLIKEILRNKKAKVIIGGGETVNFFQKLTSGKKLAASGLFLSTGGGAMIAYLSGEKLPGIEALKK